MGNDNLSLTGSDFKNDNEYEFAFDLFDENYLQALHKLTISEKAKKERNFNSEEFVKFAMSNVETLTYHVSEIDRMEDINQLFKLWKSRELE